MRSFSKFEKKIIERMIELDDKSGSLNVMSNIYDSFSKELSLPDYCYVKIMSETDISIQIKNNVIEKIDSSSLLVLDDSLSKVLLTTVKLFEYLEKNGLAYFIGDLELNSLGMVWANTEYVKCEFLEAESKKLIYKYVRKKIYVTEELKELFNNHFKSKEQIWHEEVLASTEKELLYTRVALSLTFLGLLASIIIPLLSTTKIEIKKEIKVKNLEQIYNKTTKQLHELVISMDNVGSEVNELRKTVIQPIKEIHKSANVSKAQKSVPNNINR